MNPFKPVVAGLLIAGFLAAPVCALAADAPADKPAPAPQAPAKKTEQAKPYPLKTCVVSGDKLGGDMGAPYVFAYKGQEIKLCCKDCKKDFDKSPAKFMKKIASAEKANPPKAKDKTSEK